MGKVNVSEELIDTLKNLAIGHCSIALSGSCATGNNDAVSDLDIYMLIEKSKSHDEMYDIISKIASEDKYIYISESFDLAPYGGAINFVYNNIAVEVTVKYFSKIAEQIKESLNGKFDIIPQTWTSNGYYTYICLSEMSFIKPIWESNGFIKYYKTLVQEYPEKLRQSIISCFMSRADTWINNFHYDSAITRNDYMFTVPIIVHTVLDMIQVILAINRVYFWGDKRLQDSLKNIQYCPESLLENMLFLFQTSLEQDVLRKQQNILIEINKELHDKILEEKI